MIRDKVKGIKHLAGMADAEFTPAFLAYQGMALSAPPHAILTAEWVGGLLDKAQAFDEAGSAIEYVCEWLRRALQQQVADRVQGL